MAKKTTKGRRANKANPMPPRQQETEKHPEQWERDLNPNRMQGQNIGRNPAQSEASARSAADIKSLTERLTGFRGDELARIPVIVPGTRLKQGAVYLDLRAAVAVPFTASGEIIAAEHNYFTPKAEVPYELWNRLVEALGPAPVGAVNPSEPSKPFSPEAAEAQRNENELSGGTHAGGEPVLEEAMIDETLADTFPASDAPAWTAGRRKSREPSETSNDELNSLSDQELTKKARDLGLPGLDSMNREQLILALRGQLSGTEV